MNIFIVILFSILLSGSVIAQESDFSDFNNSINDAQRHIDRSRTLLPHDKLHSLILDLDDLVPTSSSVTGGSSFADGDSGNTSKPGSSGDNPGKSSSASSDKEGGSSRDNSPPGVGSIVDNSDSPASLADDDINKKLAAELARKKAELARLKKAALLKKKNARKASGYQYVSPLSRRPKNSKGVNTAAVSMPVSHFIRYGISIGTQINVELNQGASNIQPGFIAVVLLDDVVGYKDTLPAGSTVFAKSQAVLGSDRLFLTASKVLNISDNSEISINGIIRATDGKAGLHASVKSDPRDFDRAVAAGENAIVSSVIDTISTDSIVGNAAQSVSSTLHDQKSARTRFENGQTVLVVEAPPQKAILIIEATF